MESMILGFKDGSRKHETCLCISYRIMKAFVSKKLGKRKCHRICLAIKSI